jgi:drug/metabolite transporter (DMT)-like permease
VASGLGAAVGFSSFYRALAIGQMGINAPIAAITTNSLAVFFGIWREGLPAGIQIVGFVLSLVAISLMTASVGQSGRPKGLGLALCAGVGFSIYLISSRQAARDAVYWPLVVARASSVVGLLSFAMMRRTLSKPASKLLLFLTVGGVLDAAGNVLFVYAVRHGRLDVATALSSLYPAITVVLARVALKERITKLQTTGLAFALAAVPMIAAH